MSEKNNVEKKLYELYSYVVTNEADFNLLLHECFRDVFVKSESEKEMLNTSRICLEEFIKEVIAKDHLITSRFINNKLIKLKLGNLDFLTTLSNFFYRFDFIPTIDFSILLINENKYLSKVLKEVNDKIKNEQYTLDDFSNDIIALIEAYQLKEDSLNRNAIFKDDDYVVESKKSVLSDYISSLSGELLSYDQEKELGYRILNGDNLALKELIEKNLRYVIYIAKRYTRDDALLLDLIQEGNIGLMEAAKRYDVTLGCRFITYANWWIKNYITTYLNRECGGFNLSFYQGSQLQKLKRFQTKFMQEYGTEPSIEQIAAELGVTIKTAKKFYDLQFDVLSLNELISKEDDTEMIDLIADEDESLEQTIEKEYLNNKIAEMFKLCRLKDDEIKVLAYRYGFYDGECYTMKDIGVMLNKTKQRVDQIEKNALNKIRKSPYIKEFVLYLDKPDKALETLDEYNQKYYEKVKTKSAREKQYRLNKKHS